MTFDDFLATAKKRYGVTLQRLRTTTGVNSVLLVRPPWEKDGVMQDARCFPQPRLQLDARMPAETIGRVCRALDMKPSDFDLFIG